MSVKFVNFNYSDTLEENYDAKNDKYMDEELDNDNIQLENFEQLKCLSVSIIVVGHDFYHKQLQNILQKCKAPQVVMDIPNIYIDDFWQFPNMIYWNL